MIGTKRAQRIGTRPRALLLAATIAMTVVAGSQVALGAGAGVGAGSASDSGSSLARVHIDSVSTPVVFTIPASGGAPAVQAGRDALAAAGSEISNTPPPVAAEAIPWPSFPAATDTSGGGGAPPATITVAAPASDNSPSGGSSSSSASANGGGADLGTFMVTCYALQGTTADGDQAGPQSVAVDPSVIPLGTKIWIQNVGVRTADDTGGSVQGRHVDIWESSEAACTQFGREYLDVRRAS